MEQDRAADILAERRSFADTLADVGAAAPTLAGAWTAGDVAAHVVSLDRLGGVPTFVGRTVVSRGIRLNDAARRFADAGITSTRRRGFAWVLERLRSSPPRLLLRGRGGTDRAVRGLRAPRGRPASLRAMAPENRPRRPCDRCPG